MNEIIAWLVDIFIEIWCYCSQVPNTGLLSCSDRGDIQELMDITDNEDVQKAIKYEERATYAADDVSLKDIIKTKEE